MSKEERLISCLKELKSAAVAFSGGVDSALLLYAAHKALGERVLAVTAVSEFIKRRETDGARAFCKSYGIRQVFADIRALDIKEIRQNPKDRCYYCKRVLMGALRRSASDNGFDTLLEGTNADDAGDFRPGERAVLELNVRSPLKELGFNKADIRALAKKWGLSVWDKPADACLATRIAVGDEITAQRLDMIERSEKLLCDNGFSGVRVRCFGDTAVIETMPDDIGRLAGSGVRGVICSELLKYGFKRVTVDLVGYRRGSMNS